MVRITQTFIVTVQILAAGCWLSTGACSSSSDSGTGGATSAAGTTGSSGTPGTGGAPGSGGAANNTFTPSCSDVPLTANNMAPGKGLPCVATDTQLCYKTCGPASIGFKSETCMGGVYVEQTGCSFPTGVDYACYKIPAAIDPSCPTTAPKATDPCDVAECTLCNVGGVTTGTYNDSSGASKVGWCVCPAASDAGVRAWTCASATAWPCPAGQGCQ